MPAYVIGQLDIFDRDAFQLYLDGFMPSFTRHGGQLLAVSAGETTVIEGSWGGPRTVVMRFPDRAAAEAWHADPEYRELTKLRHAAARTNLAIVDGLDVPIPEDGA